MVRERKKNDTIKYITTVTLIRLKSSSKSPKHIINLNCNTVAINLRRYLLIFFTKDIRMIYCSRVFAYYRY